MGVIFNIQSNNRFEYTNLEFELSEYLDKKFSKWWIENGEINGNPSGTSLNELDSIVAEVSLICGAKCVGTKYENTKC